ncbi:hypothetical protein KJ359_008182 [Pestalotiopsis sp. 9143b]|nr:hypothetical protein KJ359_008182 [Pestalotiopsis sp. 9143b]
MSVFNVMKKGREQAKQHNANEAEKAKEAAVKAPYKHVPTHAATDALSGAPANWQEDYRRRIKEQNQKRNSRVSTPEPGRGNMPRVSSSLSNVSYPPDQPGPFVPTHRTEESSSDDELEIRHTRSAPLNARTSSTPPSARTVHNYHSRAAAHHGEALSIQAVLSSFPAPPDPLLESSTSSPAMSHYFSYASSARSAASSTAPSSTASTPAAEPASFPWAGSSTPQAIKKRDQGSPIDQNRRPSSALEIKPPKEVKKHRWSFLPSRRSAAIAA